MPAVSFALNHMAAPGLSIEPFFALAKTLGIASVEIRNDLAGNAIIDGTLASAVRAMAAENGMSITSINALQRFNEWNATREAEAIELADYARDAGAQALVLVPVNDGTGQADGERQRNLRTALSALKTILGDRGVRGLVEPLGFEICSLRSKREAAEAIEDVGGTGAFRMVHDTFHHHLAGEPDLFPGMTGLVHISGVDDPGVTVPDMRDPHRVLVDAGDRLDNVGQIRALIAGGYKGLLSFEPFSPVVHKLADPRSALAESIAFIRASV
ncbi:TIM barrel protein [Aminobacter aganoensis]|uniref:2-keto-myo-inositol isomerase n=1 Tax=Aminobacter aganoensis TaxID=83264 RepID=A0A7X0F8V6_9HYPH|nr:TIM barrel protein [Aminobacter aganoensis]MBB6355103.1 2-keto-myo-inositol isomerase [Aminobacter aganoensis]